MYSQNNEEQLIIDYFDDDHGTFLDIGAYDGKTLSNTLACAERGWRGTLIEAAPGPFLQLLELYGEGLYGEGGLSFKLINAAVTHDDDDRPMGEFYHAAEWASTLDCRTVQRHNDKVFTEYIVPLLRVSAICSGQYDLFSIDIEGWEWGVVRDLIKHGMIGNRTAKQMVIVEHAHVPQVQWEALFTTANFKLLTRNNENFIFVNG